MWAEFWKDLLQLGAQVSGVVSAPLAVILWVGAGGWLLWSLWSKIRKRAIGNGPHQSRAAVVWRRRLAAFLHMLPIIGIVVGGLLFTVSVAWVLADNRRANEETIQVLSRYVLPRHLSEEQIGTIGGYLSKYAPCEAKFVVVKNSEEASSYRSDIQRALQLGGWTITSIDYSDDIREGITTQFTQTIESSQARPDPKHPKVDELFRQALEQAHVQLTGTGANSGQGIKNNVFAINIGRRRMDDGDLVAKKREQERARRILEEE